MITDAELMAAFADRKDALAFNEILRRYQKLVWSVAFRFTANIDDTKDIVQDTFIRLMVAAGRYSASASLSTFIYRTVTNLCLDFKKKKRSVFFDETDSVTDIVYEEDYGEQLDEKYRVSQLTEAVSTLPMRQTLAKDTIDTVMLQRAQTQILQMQNRLQDLVIKYILSEKNILTPQ